MVEFRKEADKHKVFLSYYHKSDESWRDEFEDLFDDIMISKSVEPGDIHPDNSDEYVKQLIREEYITDSSVIVVLVGPETWGRKHVDWEIYAGLYPSNGRSGLVGIMLPNHPDYGRDDNKYNPDLVPPRLHDNMESDYAQYYYWTEDVNQMDERIQEAFDNRGDEDSIENGREQMKKNKSSV